LVPIVLSLTLFGEKPNIIQIIGFVLAIGTIILINSGGERGGKFGIGLPLLLLIGGIADGMSKVFEEIGETEYKPQFLLFTFLFALIFTGLLMLFKKEKLGKNELIYGILIGVPNFFSAKFLLMALGSVPAVIAYPTFSVGTIIITTLSGVLLFKESLRKLQWIALVGILVSLVLLNI
jgi:multidrug transporter EmrE-like cation transporter